MIRSQQGKSQQPRQRNQNQRRNNNDDDFGRLQLFNGDDFQGRMMQNMNSHFEEMWGQSIIPHHPFRGFDDIDNEIMRFSDLHDSMMASQGGRQQGGQCQMVSKSYVQSTKTGPDGQTVTQKYFDNSKLDRGVDGKTISEREQGYKNSGGVDKYAHERRLNDEGRKYIKERNRQGQIATTDHYYNIDETNRDQFDQNWNDYSQKVHFSQQQRRLGQQVFEQPEPIGFGHRRANDIQPTQPMALPYAQTQPQAYTQSQAYTQPPAQQIPQRQRNEHSTGIYQNRNIGRGQFPPQG